MLYQKEIDDSVLIQFILLFTLSKVNQPVAYDTLLNLIMENCNVNYGEFQIALDNLMATDHVRSFLGEKNKTMYEILTKGKYANDFFQSNIPIYIREPIEKSIKPMLKEEQIKQRVQADILPVRRGEFAAECALYDDDGTQLLQLCFYAGPRPQATAMVKRFKEHPDDIYKAVLDALTEEAGQQEQQKPEL